MLLLVALLFCTLAAAASRPVDLYQGGPQLTVNLTNLEKSGEWVQVLIYYRKIATHNLCMTVAAAGN